MSVQPPLPLARGRRAVIVPAILVALAVAVHVAGTRPLASRTARTISEIQDTEQDLAWMQHAAARLAGSASAPGAAISAPASGSLLAIVEDSARGAALRIEHMQPAGAAGVRVSFEQVGFDALVAWLATLRARHGLQASALAVHRPGPSGLVTAEVVLAADTGAPR